MPGGNPVGFRSTATGSSPGLGRTAQQLANINISMTALVTDSACLSASVLALMLRYATFVQPQQSKKKPGTPSTPSAAPFVSPTKKAAISTASPGKHTPTKSQVSSTPTTPLKDQQDSTDVNNDLMAVLVTTVHALESELRSSYSSSKSNYIDVFLRLKLRCIAALGELSFYISAQESSVGSAEPSLSVSVNTNKWAVIPAVWDIFLSAMNEEIKMPPVYSVQEITRHYATKVISALYLIRFPNRCISIPNFTLLLCFADD